VQGQGGFWDLSLLNTPPSDCCRSSLTEQREGGWPFEPSHAEAIAAGQRDSRENTLLAFAFNTRFCLARILDMATDRSFRGSALTYQSKVVRAEARWKEEAASFDRDANERAHEVLPIDPQTLRRYTAHRLRRRSSAECRFRVARSLQGKRVLDVGCGDGNSSVLLAKLGAHVTGIDVSCKSIELAKKRAEVNGGSNIVQFICSPVEETEIPPHSFDVIWGDAILHHLIENLEFVLRQLTLWQNRGHSCCSLNPSISTTRFGAYDLCFQSKPT
jgi:2-polyprenyl-3-methyl-5-hydroxy-6-metoxy-1,4-benzoquinol methylase